MRLMHFAVIGHPIGHTLSPVIHKMLFELTGTNADYVAIDVPPDSLEESFKNTLSKLDGFNVTIPHKSAVIPLLDKICGKAERCGSVNTVKTGTENLGFTTDADGFLKAIENAGVTLGGRVLILGAGGAARTIAYECAEKGCQLTLAVRNVNKGNELAADIICDFSDADINVCRLDEIDGRFDLLINTTPVGMSPNTDVSPVGREVVQRCDAVFDAIYNPKETLLLRYAREAGVKAIGGMDMLVWQAAQAQSIWLNVEFNPADIDRIAAKMSSEVLTDER